MFVFELEELKGRQLQHFLQPGDIDLLQETLKQFHPGTRFVAKINVRYETKRNGQFGRKPQSPRLLRRREKHQLLFKSKT